jgi:dTDP-4-amino-4,6-dideoxygalactose transaminase
LRANDPDEERAVMLESHPTLRFADLLRLTNRAGWLREKSIVVHYTYNARGAIYQFLRSLPADRGNTVLVPGFHCFAAVEPVVLAGYRPLFYRIREDLSVDQKDLCEKLSREIAAVLVIHFCGFPTNMDAILPLREKYGFYLIEDWAHSFVRDENGALAGDIGDVAVFSFYKLAPCHAGGGLRINVAGLTYQGPTGRIGIKDSIVAIKRLVEQLIENSDQEMIKSAFHYAEEKRVALRKKNVSLLNRSGPVIPDSYLVRSDLAVARMPWFSRAILRASDLRAIVSSRRRNFEILSKNIEESGNLTKVYKNLPENVCPWAYPVLVKERSSHDHILRARGVPVFTFGETLHPEAYRSDARVVESGKFLSTNLLMIPLHQQLDSKEMMWICQNVNAVIGGAN